MKPTKTDDPNATARRADHQNKQSNNLNQSDIGLSTRISAAC
jgi:hypothetical protein